jgi:hypothetical protein
MRIANFEEKVKEIKKLFKIPFEELFGYKIVYNMYTDKIIVGQFENIEKNIEKIYIRFMPVYYKVDREITFINAGLMTPDGIVIPTVPLPGNTDCRKGDSYRIIYEVMDKIGE